MFGRSPQNNGHTTPPKPRAADEARIEGGGLVQLIVTSLSPTTFYLFLNDREVPQIDVESLSVYIEAPPENSRDSPTVRATLSQYVTNVTGEKTQQHTELFPCTLEIIALGRRISVTCMHRDSLEGLYVNLGLKADGSSDELSGLQVLQFLLTEELLDAKLTWVDGTTEDLFPQ